MTGATILFAEMTPDADWEGRFNKWYDTHYIPSRMAIPHFLGAQRYKDLDRPNYLAVYELSSPDALASPEYAKLRAQPNSETKWVLANISGLTRYVGDQISEQTRDGVDIDPLDAPFLYPVFFSVPDDRASEFNDWYTEEHVPMLLKSKDWLMCRRFVINDGDPEPWTHLAIHYLADARALDSPERAAARDTDRRKKLSAEAWFRAKTQLFQRHGTRFLATAAPTTPSTRRAV